MRLWAPIHWSPEEITQADEEGCGAVIAAVTFGWFGEPDYPG